ncbi:hypothetical protein [Nocardia sp. NPDC050793]|uniref:hypothetical protein n=1 Tax=Nocardia sp. NPDC050793 TaxID=3155159 RepID=UPI0033F1F53A
MGTNSVREVMRRTAVPLPSVAKQLQIASIGSFYLRSGGVTGSLGLPLKNVQFAGDGSGNRHFAGGRVQFLRNSPRKIEQINVRVRFVGFHTHGESNELSASDEPYFIIGVAATNGSKTVRFGPYENVDKDEDRSEATLVCDVSDGLTPPIVLAVIGMENDEGDPEEAEKKVRDIMNSVVSKVEEAAGAIGAFSGEHFVIPEGWRDVLIGWGAEAVAAILGLGDDLIDKAHRVLFDFDPELDEWKKLPKLGDHLGNPFNVTLRVKQENEGDHTLFFNVDLFRQTIEPLG